MSGNNILRKKYAPLLLLALCISGCKDDSKIVIEQAPRPVKMMKVSDVVTGNIRQYPARVTANKEVAVSFQVAGRLVHFSVKPGDKVKQGDIIAKVDDRDFLNQRQLAQADYDLARTNFTRYQSLLKKKMISQAQFDSAGANLKATEANLRLAIDRVEYSTIFAPFDGVISQTQVENHQYIQPQQTIAILQNSDIIDVRIQLPAGTLYQIQEGRVDIDYQPLVTFVSDSDKTYPTSYKQHATQVTPGTQSYEVTFSLPRPEDVTIYPGMAATLNIDFDKVFLDRQYSNYIAVPLTAVIKDDASGETLIWVFDESSGQVHPRSVEIGKIVEQSILIKAELNKDERLITAGLNRLKDGMEVVPLVVERGL